MPASVASGAGGLLRNDRETFAEIGLGLCQLLFQLTQLRIQVRLSRRRPSCELSLQLTDLLFQLLRYWLSAHSVFGKKAGTP